MSPTLAAVVLLALAGAIWFVWRRTVQVPCTIDLEATHDHFHAHVALEGVAPNEGDTVLVEQAPTRVRFGDRQVVRSRATVRQASALRRWWTRWRSRLDVTELYEVGFE